MSLTKLVPVLTLTMVAEYMNSTSQFTSTCDVTVDATIYYKYPYTSTAGTFPIQVYSSFSLFA